MIVIGIFGAVMIILTTLKVKERREFHQVDQPLPIMQASPLYIDQPLLPDPGSPEFYVGLDASLAAGHVVLPGGLCFKNGNHGHPRGGIHSR